MLMEDTEYVSEQYIVCIVRIHTDTPDLKQLVCIVTFKTLGQSDNYT